MQRSDLPFGSEFSPLQIVLPDLLEIIEASKGDWHALEAAILKRYFSGHAEGSASEEASYNRGKLANNCKLGLIAYGVIERSGVFTDFGHRLLPEEGRSYCYCHEGPPFCQNGNRGAEDRQPRSTSPRGCEHARSWGMDVADR